MRDTPHDTNAALVARHANRWNDAAMSESDYTNPLQLAHDNLEEANRQLARATADFNAGRITQQRLDQLQELRDIAAADVNRVAKES
jgi:hypothetical protein